MSKALQLLLAVTFVLAGCEVSIADDCKFTAERTGQLAIAGAKRIAITARAGDLDVRGRKGATEVAARGKACASDQKLLDLIRIDLRLDGEVLHIDALMPDIEADDAPRNAAATLDLKLEVPDNLPVELIDSSGDAEIDGIASLDMTDSSGDLRISRVAGDLELRDSSGDVRIDEIGKNVRLEDSSGDVNIEDAHGDVLITADGSGELVLERIERNVTVERDGSGDIHIAQVKGNARIDSDGSGEVDVRDVGGSFTLGGKGSGQVHVAEVKGEVLIPPEKHE
jgi:hypothetical protein